MQLNAPLFLSRYGHLFAVDELQSWVWGGEDDEFGKSLSWDLQTPAEGQPFLVNASVELQLTMLNLSISERDLSHSNNDTEIVFSAQIYFDEERIVLNGDALVYSSESIAIVVRAFNEGVFE